VTCQKRRWSLSFIKRRGKGGWLDTPRLVGDEPGRIGGAGRLLSRNCREKEKGDLQQPKGACLSKEAE